MKYADAISEYGDTAKMIRVKEGRRVPVMISMAMLENKNKFFLFRGVSDNWVNICYSP